MNDVFFETDCKEPSTNAKRFGICDMQNGQKAYTDKNDEGHWIATVVNKNALEISFTPIDNCIVILKPGTNNKQSTCDGMLTFSESLYLVELKKQRTGGWISDAKEQLENTIKLISENSNLSNFKYKKAFACNRKHPNFAVIDSAEKKAFFRRTNGFRLDVQAEIAIK